MNILIKTSFLISVLSVSACSHYSEDLASMDSKMTQPQQAYAALTSQSPDAIEPAAGGVGMAGDINAVMAREYYQLARYENDQAYDYKAAKSYTNKAMAAVKGKTPMPSSVSAFDVTPQQEKELKAARAALVTALKEQNHPENHAALAKAQVSFDCWLERAEEAQDASHYASCKEAFEQSMAVLVMPAAGGQVVANTAGTNQYEILFAQNSTSIDPASFNVIEQIGWFLKSPDGRGYTATLTGYSDAKIETEYSRKLVSNRIRMVREALVAHGISESALRPEISVATLSNPTVSRSVQVVLVPPMMPSANVTMPVTTAVAPSQLQDIAPAAAASEWQAPVNETAVVTPEMTPVVTDTATARAQPQSGFKIVPNTRFSTN